MCIQTQTAKEITEQEREKKERTHTLSGHNENGCERRNSNTKK